MQVSVVPTLKPTSHWLASHLPAPSDVHSLQFGAHAENRLDIDIIFRITIEHYVEIVSKKQLIP